MTQSGTKLHAAPACHAVVPLDALQASLVKAAVAGLSLARPAGQRVRVAGRLDRSAGNRAGPQAARPAAAGLPPAAAQHAAAAAAVQGTRGSQRGRSRGRWPRRGSVSPCASRCSHLAGAAGAAAGPWYSRPAREHQVPARCWADSGHWQLGHTSSAVLHWALHAVARVRHMHASTTTKRSCVMVLPRWLTRCCVQRACASHASPDRAHRPGAAAAGCPAARPAQGSAQQPTQQPQARRAGSSRSHTAACRWHGRAGGR